ncbi:MAG: hypothetical protein Greene071436_207 [Parcubacteria group bacterium Greene0714_36]|nr:MAG: hypothetical protein Greene071436_207 [Parcubacteria group bacterium Greene0714_36]
MKTIFITIFEGIESKNILRTAILPVLLSRADVRVVLFVKDAARAAYHAREFHDPRILYEVAEPLCVSGPDALFVRLKFLLLNTKTTRLRRRMRYEEDGGKVSYFSASLLQYLLARPWAVHLARVLDRALVHSETYGGYFEKYHPELLLCANLFDEPEVHFLREAKRRGVAVVGLINSWDKATSRGMLRLLPDRLVVFNGYLRDDLLRYHAVPADKIFIGGIPQYDQYFSFRPESRSEFFRRLGLDARQRLIVYSPIGSICGTADWDIIDMIEQYRREGAFGDGMELLVRFPPNDFVDQKEIKKRPWLRYQHPGVRFSEARGTGIDWDMTFPELEELANTLFHMSMVICYASSISVDAAVIDRPVINIGFELRPRVKGVKSPVQFYRQTHYEKALATGGIHLAHTREDLVEWVRQYLAHPECDREGRRRLATEQCAFLDGKSGERIGAFILDFLAA